MAITMKELAYMAGVSRATVDRVLNDRGGVNPETAQRINILAKSMGYKPNIAAKSLAKGMKDVKIGCIINRLGNTFFDDVIKGVMDASEELSRFGISVIIKDAKLNVRQQLDLIDELIESNVNAIAITPINDNSIIEKLNQIIESGITVIALTADISNVNYLAYVGCNHERSGKIAADLVALMSNKSANVSIIAGSLKMLGHSQRIKGFRSIINKKYPLINIIHIIENEDDDIISYNKVSKLIQEDSSIDIMFFAGAGIKGGIRALIDNDCVNQIKILAFDLTETNRQYLSQGIISTLLCQEPYTQGYTAIKTLSDYLLYDIKPSNSRIYTRTEIMVSESL